MRCKVVVEVELELELLLLLVVVVLLVEWLLLPLLLLLLLKILLLVVLAMVGWFVKLARAISCCFGLMLLLPLPVPPMLHVAGVASSGPALVATTNDVCV